MKSLLLYFSLSFWFFSISIAAQIPSNVVVEAFIDQLTSKVAKEQLRSQQMGLIKPLTLALGNAKVNLLHYLDEEIGETPVEVLSVLVSLNDIVNQFMGQTHLEDLNRQILELPFYIRHRKRFPFIEDVTPSKLLLVGNTVDISLRGHFIAVQEEDFHASIVLTVSVPISSGTGFTSYRNSVVTIMPIEKKADLIRFQVPLEYLAAYRKRTSMLYLNLDLGVPQKSESDLVIRKVRYTLPFKLLPSSPGTIRLSYEQTATNNKTEKRQTRTFVQHSTNKYITENYYLPQTNKETIVAGSEKLVVEWSDGKQGQDWSYYKHNTSKGSCFTVETVYNPASTSGKVNFHITYEVEKQTTTTAQKNSSVELDWNDYQRFGIGYNTKWKIDFTDYMGAVRTFRDPVNTELLSIAKSGKNLVITTPGIDMVVE